MAEILEVNGPGFLDALMLGAFEHDQRDRTVRELPVLEGDELRARLRDMAPPPDLATDDAAGGGSSERVEGGIAPVDVVEHADGGGSGGNAGQLTTSRDPATPLPD